MSEVPDDLVKRLRREGLVYTHMAAAAEIERLRQRLAKIALAPVPEDNEVAMALKGWAMPRDGEFPYV